MSLPTEVTIPCPCPETPHPDGDTVHLWPKLGLLAGIAVQKLVVDAIQAGKGLTSAETQGILAEGYLLWGVRDWTLVDEKGAKRPVDHDAIRACLLSDFAVAAPVADAADDLYMEAVIAPLLKRVSTSSRNGSTNGSTSPRPSGGGERRKRSKRSSTTTTPTVAIAPTSR